MYKMTLEIADDDMKFLAERAPVYGKESAAAMLQALVEVAIRNEYLEAKREERRGPGWVAMRMVILRILEDEYRLAEEIAEKRGLANTQTALELLLTEAINAAPESGGDAPPRRS
jgi:hypothetical protein